MADVTDKTSAAVNTAAGPLGAISAQKAPGLQFRRYFSKADVSPYDQFQWELRTASITDALGRTIFEQKDVEVPKDWSMTATNIVASGTMSPSRSPSRVGCMSWNRSATGRRRGSTCSE